MTTLQIGDTAPIFNEKDQNGNTVSLSDFKGKKVALFFYPKDNTPGCTKEACSIRDGHTELLAAGIVPIGVSPDDAKSHNKFIDKFDLPFTLLTDTELTIAKQYEVWGPKQFMGRDYIGLHRTTFIIDEEGKIEQIIGKVVTKDHANQILETLKE